MSRALNAAREPRSAGTRSKAAFGDVVGISLVAPCTFRFRRKAGAKSDSVSFVAEPRSAYVLQGAARRDREHSVPGVESLGYSITFRTLAAPA